MAFLSSSVRNARLPPEPWLRRIAGFGRTTDGDVLHRPTFSICRIEILRAANRENGESKPEAWTRYLSCSGRWLLTASSIWVAAWDGSPIALLVAGMSRLASTSYKTMSLDYGRRTHI